MKTIALAALLVFTFPPWALAGAGWKSVEKILGRSGEEQGGVFRVEFPREDLNVTVQGLPLEPGLALTSRFYFKPLDKGTLLMGEWILLDQEVAQVTAQLRQNGFQVTHVHPFLPDASPGVQMLHIRGQGSRANLAQALRRVLSVKPLSENAVEKPLKSLEWSQAPIPAPSPHPSLDWTAVEKLLGAGRVRDKILEYEIDEGPGPFGEIPSSMGMETLFRFQKVQGAAVGKKSFWGWGKKSGVSKDVVAVTGQFLLTPDQVEGVRRILARGQATVTHTQALTADGKALLFYFWLLGPAPEAASTLQALLERIRTRK